MSQNIVDSVIELAEDDKGQLALIPSRGQIDYIGGYSSNWKTSELHDYVKSRTNKVLLARDHAGPKQGAKKDHGFDSLYEDCKFMDIIHIDPWKDVENFEEGHHRTQEYIQFCHHVNPNVSFEIGTEEAIFHYEVDQLERLILFLRDNLLSTAYDQIKYAVVQSGTLIRGIRNAGTYSESRLMEMVGVCHKYDLLSKEHNGDYLTNDGITSRFKAGLDAINIAPEFGQIETKTLLKAMQRDNRQDLVDELYQLCYSSQKWRKWVNNKFNPILNKEDLIRMTGHYVFSDPYFKIIKNQFAGIDAVMKNEIKAKITCLLKLSEDR